jgi:hypothetical protein
MARPKRLKLKGEEGFFHITSRTVGQEFFLGDVEKEKLFNMNVKSAIDNKTYNHELMRDFKLPKGEIMLGRIRYFSDGMVIGSKKFLKEAYATPCPLAPISWQPASSFTSHTY